MKKINKLKIRKHMTCTHEGASAYDYSKIDPQTHLTFTCGSALITDGYYQTQGDEVFRLVDALMAVYEIEPRFAWQYGAWMRDPKNGKGNRVQGSLVPAILDGLYGMTDDSVRYIAMCLSHRPDDVVAFYTHFDNLGLGKPSSAARMGMAIALTSFDEYQLMKYAMKNEDVRLCDVIYMVRDELDVLGDKAKSPIAVGEYLHAPSRKRAKLADELELKLTQNRKALWSKDKSFVDNAEFKSLVQDARVTWEQVFSHFGKNAKDDGLAAKRNHKIWKALLDQKGLMGDMAFMRNMRNFLRDDFTAHQLESMAHERSFAEIWPHQVYAAYRAVPDAEAPLDVIFKKMAKKLPHGRHLGIADISGSMSVKVGGPLSSSTSMDVAICLTALMSESSGLGASFADDSFKTYSDGKYLHVAQRTNYRSPLAFTKAKPLHRGWGGTQVFGAVMDLIRWLMKHRDQVQAPDCLWFFSDMQFHPAAGGADAIPGDLTKLAKKLGVERSGPPLEIALRMYRAMFGHVDVVLWNLAAYSPVPVPADMPGVLLVSGFDTNTFKQVEAWRSKRTSKTSKVAENQQTVLEAIRRF